MPGYVRADSTEPDPVVVHSPHVEVFDRVAGVSAGVAVARLRLADGAGELRHGVSAAGD